MSIIKRSCLICLFLLLSGCSKPSYQYDNGGMMLGMNIQELMNVYSPKGCDIKLLDDMPGPNHYRMICDKYNDYRDFFLYKSIHISTDRKGSVYSITSSFSHAPEEKINVAKNYVCEIYNIKQCEYKASYPQGHYYIRYLKQASDEELLVDIEKGKASKNNYLKISLSVTDVNEFAQDIINSVTQEEKDEWMERRREERKKRCVESTSVANVPCGLELDEDV